MRHLAPNDSRITERNRGGDVSSRPGARSTEIGSCAEAVLATLLESQDCGILLFGPGGDLWAVNDRFAEILGIEPARLRELSNLEQIVDVMASQLAQGDSGAARWRQQFRSGEAFWDELELTRPEDRGTLRAPGARPL
jgi:PAS domain-containing protein